MKTAIEAPDQIIDQAVFVIESPTGSQAGNDHGHGPGDQDNGPQEPFAPEIDIEQQRQGNAKYNVKEH